MFDYLALKQALRKLRNNEQNIPKEILLQKYRKSYTALRTSIAEMTQEMIQAIAFEPFSYLGSADDIPEQLASKFSEDCKEIISEEEKIGTLKQISRVIFQEYDLDKALEIAFRRYHTRILYEAVPPVWLYYCQERPGGGYANRLIGMRWVQTGEDDEGYWERRNRNGTWDSAVKLPPTWNGIMKQYEKEKVRSRKESGE